MLNLSENLNTLKLRNDLKIIYESQTSNIKIRFFSNIFVRLLKASTIVVDLIVLVDLTNKVEKNQKKLLSIRVVETHEESFDELILINSFLFQFDE